MPFIITKAYYVQTFPSDPWYVCTSENQNVVEIEFTSTDKNYSKVFIRKPANGMPKRTPEQTDAEYTKEVWNWCVTSIG